MRIYQTWLKKHLVSFLSPQKGAYFDLPACLANTDKHRHWAGRSQQKFGLLRKFMFGTRHPQSFPLSRRVSELPRWGAGSSRGGQETGTAEPSSGAWGAAAPSKPQEHSTNHLPARPWASLLQGTHSRQPLPQYKTPTPTCGHGVLMKNTWIWPFWGIPQCISPSWRCERSNTELAEPKPCAHMMRLLHRCNLHTFSSASASPTGEKPPSDFQGSQIELVC